MNERAIRQWFDLLKREPDPNNPSEEKPFLFEVRILDGKKTYSGYFKDVETMLKEIRPYDGMGIYATLNAVKEECFSRLQSNRIIANPKETTSAPNIEHRNVIMLDFDPKRSSGICATEEEKNKARAVANKVYKFLRDNNFESPCVADSCNGVHAYYRVALANTDENTQLVKRFLNVLNMLFGTEDVECDCSTYDPNRIAKIIGTSTNKGTSTTERPHRESYWVKVPDEFKVTPKELIERIANMMPVAETPSKSNHYAPAGSFNLQEFFEKYEIKIAKTETTKDYTKYVLDTCPFCGNHAPDSAVFEMTRDHSYGFFCFHHSCQQYSFRDFRLHFDPSAYDNKTYSEYVHKRNYYGMYHRPEFVPEPEKEDKGPKWKKLGSVKKAEISSDDYVVSGFPTLDSAMVGFRRGHLSLWSGLRGSAKSTILNMCILNAAQRGFKTALWTAELDDTEVKNWLYLQASGKAYNKPSKFSSYFYTPRSVVEKIDPWIDQYVSLYEQAYGDNYLQLENDIRELHAKDPHDVYIADNIMCMDLSDLDGDKYDKQKEMVKRLVRLAKELKIVIHLVGHPNKSLGFLRPNSISGSGNMPDLAQNIFICHRINTDFERSASEFLPKDTLNDILTSGCTNVIEICKCRDKGAAVGTFVKLWFEIESNRLKSDPYEVINYNWQEIGHQTSIEDLPSYELQDVPFSTNFSSPSSDDDWLTQETEEAPF